jgi:hypothetical protein
LPERAQRALNVLSEIWRMLEGAPSVAMDWAKPASDDIADTIRTIGKLTTIAERGDACDCAFVRSRALSDARGNTGTKVGVALI